MNNNDDSFFKGSPMSVRFDHSTRVLIKRAAVVLHYSQSQVVNETVKQTLIQIDSAEIETVPDILTRLRVVQAQQNSPAPPWNQTEPGNGQGTSE